MTEPLPRTVARELHFKHGSALGISNRWLKGQYCSILTPAGIVGCVYLFISLPFATVWRFFAWNALGLVVYWLYARHQSLLGKT